MSEIEKALAVKEKKSGNRRISGMGAIRRIFSCKLEPEGYDRLVTSRKTIHQWLAEFFEIDQDKIEKERQALLDEIRAGNH
mgnify:CR=1 FL=1